jgi:hypothetical protein
MFQYVISEGTDRPICYCQSLTKILRKHEEIHSMNIPKWKCNSKKNANQIFHIEGRYISSSWHSVYRWYRGNWLPNIKIMCGIFFLGEVHCFVPKLSYKIQVGLWTSICTNCSLNFFLITPNWSLNFLRKSKLVIKL